MDEGEEGYGESGDEGFLGEEEDDDYEDLYNNGYAPVIWLRFPNFKILGVAFIKEVFAYSEDKISDFEMKLMDIDSEHLGILEVYHAMPLLKSHPLSLLGFARISIVLVTLEGVKFSTKGDIGTTNIVCRQNTSEDKLEEATVIEMNEQLSNTITISMPNELSIVVEYKIAKIGYVWFYLAPKIEEDEEDTKPKFNLPIRCWVRILGF
ncbi:Proliferating cell nuclear antigen [Glycine soja]|nr:Proliferating cell nuclear antigen [Glycine soja]